MLLHAHSGIRYLVLLFGIAVLAYALRGALGKKPYDQTMRKLAGFYAMFFHLNILLGVALVLFTFGFAPHVFGHVLLMIFAAAAAQVVPSVMRRRPEEERTYWPYVVGTAVSLVLLWVGVAALNRPLIPGLF